MIYVWAHRGASGYAPENTLEAFKLAIDMKADGIELDVQLSKDNEIVVCHDETIDRTSDHKGNIKDYSLQQLKLFNFNNHMEGYDNVTIPTLEEVLQLIKPTNLVINIELKNSVVDYPGLEEKVLELVDKYQMNDRIIYSSFNHDSILKVKQLNAKAYCGFLHSKPKDNIASLAKENGIKALHPKRTFLMKSAYMNEARKNGLLINSWTINKKWDMIMAYLIGVNAVITNYPDLAIKVRKNLGKEK